ncbi:MAG TPA: nucleotide disphospho-sugar-binding domain-containing protein, partial [Solirubrobacterales bacterium]|nr:nucleotide disphospho-sugar-binding domain-containing protein [Solirubrobacterales bacterium]
MSGRRFLVAAFGDAGHAFPAIALARALRRRGHELLVETWERWRDPVESEGLGFTAAEEYRTFPPPEPGSGTWTSAADAAIALLPLMEDFRPDVVVSDILTLAPSLAAERAGRRRATLIPHVYPVHEPGLPFFAFGLQPPRTPVGRIMWRRALPVLTSGLRRGREEMNETRAAVGLPPVEGFHSGISSDLAMVATFPQLEYPRRWPAGVHVTGPMEFEVPFPDVELPDGDDPLVLVAPSTAQDPDLRLVRAALDALAEEPVRVLATTNRLDPSSSLPDAPSNARVVDWLSYSQLMPRAALVVCHGGHGTVARALVAGAPVLCCPHVGDMAENSARVAWAGVGLMLPWRLLGSGPLRWATRRILGDPSFVERAAEVAAWAQANDGSERGARLVEKL